MAYSTQRETSDGTLALIDIGIVYFDRSEIAVLFDGVVQLTGWTWVGTTAKQISFSPVVPAGVEVMLVRSTDLSEPRHVFTLGAKFTTESMDEDIRQILHIAQEARENATIEEVFHNLNMHGYRIVNVGAGVDPTDAANLQQMADHSAEMIVYRDQAAAYAADAQASALAAAASAASINVTNIMHRDQNLSDVADTAVARGNIGAQATLISGTNIKTVNGTSLLGAGNIVTGISDGDKGDIIVSGGGTVWTIDPSVSLGGLTLGTVQSTTSGTFKDFVIPAGVNQVFVNFNDVSYAGGDNTVVQLGTAGGIDTTHYKSVGSYVSSSGFGSAVAYTTGFITVGDSGPAVLRNGTCMLTRLTGNKWSCSMNITNTVPSPVFTMTTCGTVELTGELTTIRVTGGAGGAFDNGEVNVAYG